MTTQRSAVIFNSTSDDSDAVTPQVWGPADGHSPTRCGCSQVGARRVFGNRGIGDPRRPCGRAYRHVDAVDIADDLARARAKTAADGLTTLT